MRRILCMTLALAWLAQTSAFSAEEADQNAPLVVTMTKVGGSVEYRPDGESEWRDAVEGLKLNEGAQVSTGLASTAGLAFADNSVVVLDSLTEVVIDRFLRDSEAVRTTLKMKSGTLRAQVRSDRVRSDFRVSTPRVTGSVKGTEIHEFGTSPDLGDYVALGETGLLLVEDGRRRRYVDPRTATDSELIRLVEMARIKRRWWFPPLFGLTREEYEAAIKKPRALDVSPAEINISRFTPLGDRIKDQEFFVNDPADAERRIEGEIED